MQAAMFFYAAAGANAFFRTMKYAVIIAVPVSTQEIGYTATSACG